MEVGPFHALIWTAAVAAPLLAWILWRAGKRLADAQVSIWEKGLAIGSAAAGAAVCVAGAPGVGTWLVIAGPILLLAAAAVGLSGGIGDAPGADSGGDAGGA